MRSAVGPAGRCKSCGRTQRKARAGGQYREHGPWALIQRGDAGWEAQLMDRGIRRLQFARWLATVPPDARGEMLRVAIGEAPGLIGAEPGSREAELLAASRMMEYEIQVYEKLKRQEREGR